MADAERVGPYRLGKTLGAGSFSRVKLAVHEPTGQHVAIKVLNKQKLRRMDMGAKVRREIDVLKLFNHPHIVRLYEVIEREADIYCVMEFVEGGEMFDYIVSRGRLEEDEARRIFQQVISGVDYFHSLMVVHRDLKPENILVDEDGSVKLADFGLANVMKDGQFLKTSCGSPNYAAPEVISGDRYAGPEVDVWSCGVILYALLCGSLPFDDDDIRSLFRKIKAGTYRLPGHLSEPAVDLIRRILVVDPVARARISDIRRHPWFLASLPPYLRVSARSRIRLDGKLDDGVVAEVVRRNGGTCTHEQVAEAVRLARDENLLTSRALEHLVEERALAVSYNLLRDRKRRELIEAGDDAAGHGSPVPADPESPLKLAGRRLGGGGGGGGGGGNVSPPRPVPVRGGRAGGGDGDGAGDEQPVLTHGIRARIGPPRTRWYLGMWSSLDPVTALQELCTVLHQLGLEWKNLTPYKLKARYIYASAQQADPKVVKLGICVYRSHDLYCIDVQKLHGELFPFFDLCSAIVHRLQASAVAVPSDGSSDCGGIGEGPVFASMPPSPAHAAGGGGGFGSRGPAPAAASAAAPEPAAAGGSAGSAGGGGTDAWLSAGQDMMVGDSSTVRVLRASSEAPPLSLVQPDSPLSSSSAGDVGELGFD